MYDELRFFTITGHCWADPSSDAGGPRVIQTIEARQEPLSLLHAEVFGADLGQDDADLIRQASEAKNGDRFQRLWKGIWDGYPSWSEADLALCCHLAFWTNHDTERVDRLFRHLSLYRPKWEEVHDARGQTYGRRTIASAITSTRHRSRHQESGSSDAGTATEIDAGNHDLAIISSMMARSLSLQRSS